MPVKHLKLLILTTILTLTCLNSYLALAQDGNGPDSQPAPPAPAAEQKAQSLALARALMCEKVDNLTPVNRAVTFPVSIGQVYCFTVFDPVPKGTLVYHRWFHFDELSTQVKLKVYSPHWTTFSTIQLREADKGPWRVEVTDQNGHVFTVLRFSITD